MFGAVLLAGFAVNIHAAKPMVSISASPTTIIVGSSSTLTWTTTNATSASINNGIGEVSLNGSISVFPNMTTTYTITVRNSSGSAKSSAKVTVKSAPPTVLFSATPTSIHVGETSTLTWATTNATSASINNRIGAVSLNGSKSVSPAKTTTYTITVKGNGGTVSANATVTVLPPLPTMIFSASPETIHPGETSTLNWSSNNATSASIDNDIGSVPVNGSIVVNPSTTTTYTITLSGSGGTATAICTVTVQPYLPQASLNVSSSHALPGEAIRLYWNTENADSCSIDNGIGVVSLNGSTAVFPTQTTTYTLSATGPAGTTDVSATITVDSSLLPEVKIYSSRPMTNRWEDSTSKVALVWSAEHGETAFLDNDIGSVPLKGSVWVTPAQSTDYVITVSNGNGSVTASVRLGVMVDSYHPKWRSYVPNELDNTVSVVNSSNLTSIATVPVGAGPICTAISPDGTSVFIGNNSGKTISKIDTATNTVVKTIVLAGKPNKMDIHPDCSRLYAICEKIESGQSVWVVTVIDTASGNILGEIRMGSGSLTGIAVHPNGELLYVSHSEGKIAVIDTRSNQVINYILLNSSPGEMAIAPDGKRLYVSLQYSSSENLAVIETAVNSVESTYQVRNGSGAIEGIRFLRVRCDDKFLYASYFNYANSINYLTYLNTETFQAIRSIDCYYRVHGMALIPYENRNGNIFHIVIPTYLQEVNHYSSGISLSANVAHLGNIGSAEGNFTAYKADSVSGKVTQNGLGVSGVTIQINGEGITRTISTDVNGNYIVALRCGTYTLTPMKGDSNFSPVNIGITLDDTFSEKNFILTGSGPLPAITFTATPDTIISGGTSTLSWSVTNATTVTIDNGIGSVSLTGTRSVSPTATKNYTLTATGPGGPSTASVIVSVTNVPPPTIAIVSPKENEIVSQSPLTVSGTVTADCTVKVNSIPATVTGTGWTASVPVAAGANTLTAQATDSYGRTASATVHVTYDNTRTAKLTGTVSDYASGQPITGVLVTALDSASQSKNTQTDASGQYTIENLKPGNVQVSFAKSGYDPYQQTINIPAYTTYDLTSQMRLTLVGATLTGLVKDGQTTQPISGATVIAVFSSGSLSSTSGSDGVYALVGIPLNTPVKITASAAGYRDGIINQTYTMNAVFVYDFVLYNTSVLATINGKITNSKTLLPEPGVTVTHEGSNIAVTTAADGTFVFNDMAFGAQTFYFKKTDLIEETFTFNIDCTPFIIDLIKPNKEGGQITVGQNISGLIQDSLSQRPIAGAKVRVPGLNLEAVSDANGNYSLTDLPIGNYPLVVLAVNHQAMNFMLSVVPGETNKADFALFTLAKGLISGVITDFATGNPVAEASIAIDDSSLLAATSEGDGTYKMVGVPPGTYKIIVSHADYGETFVENVTVVDLSPTTVNLQLNKRPQTGALEGRILDVNTSNPVGGATVEVSGTAISATTDAEGKYRLTNVPAGLNNLTVSASGYPSSPRIRAVIADETPTSSSTTVTDIPIDPASSTVNEAVTQLIKANEGGDIISRDNRFVLHIFPDTLSADANITLSEVIDGPNVALGSDLPLDPTLDITGVKAASVMTKVQIASVNGIDPAPTIGGLAAVAMRYSQKDTDDFQLDENSAFPYFWDGTYFSALNPRPYELAVDKTNNIVYAVMDFSATATGAVATFVQSKLSRSGSLQGAAATGGTIADLIFIIGKIAINTALSRPNVKIFDKNELLAVTNAPSAYIPNPNALPLLVIHGFDPWSVFASMETNPNKGGRYLNMLQDIVEATNGVYRPVFVSYNTKAGLAAIGGNLAEKIHGEYLNKQNMIKGLPSKPDDPDSGNFPYLDTFGYSMGGLVARSFLNQSNLNMVHNMVMIATPNHGTFSILNYLSSIPAFSTNLESLKKWVPGAADMVDYDDSSSAGQEQNPFLYDLNSPVNSRAVMPRGDMTLFAGNDYNGFGKLGPLFDALLERPHDSVVQVRSVFCRPTGSTLGSNLSLLKVNEPRAKKFEYEKNFNHDSVGMSVRIKAFITEITRGLSDWVVEKEYNEEPLDNAFLPSCITTLGYANAKVKVEYNVWDGSDGRTARNFDRVVLVMYHKDYNGHWHISNPEFGENGADINGNVITTKVVSISGNSINRPIDNPLILSAKINYDLAEPPTDDPEKWISEVMSLVINLEPGKMTVPLDPTKASFRIPKVNE